MHYIAILGRQPALGIAELERFYGADAVTPSFESGAARISVDCHADDLSRLGGSVKLAKILTTLPTTDLRQAEKYLAKSLPQHLRSVPEGKIRFGASAYGINVNPDAINAMNLRLKKVVKNAGRSVRVVPNKTAALNSAQVLHNQLTTPIGWEIIFVRSGRDLIIAQTIAEQNIDAYAARDQARPARDAFVGMLPPKLAQIMINLAVPEKPSLNVDERKTILDPFCGTGVVLQEALLMGFVGYGTDLSEKMVDYTHRNIEWLGTAFSLPHHSWFIEQADAMSAEWRQPISAVVCESYLGQPFSAPPSPAKLDEVTKNCEHIISEFLKNIGTQVKVGTPLCIAVPAWQNKDGKFTHLPLTRMIGDLGYRRLTFKHLRDEDLLYYRPDQIVARQLLVLEKT